MTVLINSIANIIICLSVSLFMVFVFSASSKMQQLHLLERNIIKIGLAVTAAGSLLNFLTLYTPNITEIILNCGLAVIFSWGVWFHFKYFTKNHKK